MMRWKFSFSQKFCIVQLEYYFCCAYASNLVGVSIGCMNTRRDATRRVEEEISNAGAPPYGDQVSLLEEDANMEHAPAHPPTLTDKE